MFEFAFGMILPFLFGFFAGYFTNKYRVEKSELFENVNLIREDVANLQVQFSAYINK